MRRMTALAIAMMAAIACASSAQELYPAQIGAFEFAYPYPSPDETKIVFQGNFDGRWQLYEMVVATGAMRRLHTSEADELQPSWSPDGRSIAFVSNRNGNDDIFVLDLESGAVRPVAAHPGRDGHPKWSADGLWLVFNRTLDPNDRGGDRGAAIMRVRADGSGLSTLSDSANIETFPTPSPDGRSVAFVEWMPTASGGRAGDIVLVDTRTGRRRDLTHSDDFDAYPTFGASGAWVYFTTFVDDSALRRRVNVRTGLIEELTTQSGRGAVRAVPDRGEQNVFYNVDVAPGRVLLFHGPISTQ